MRNRFGHPRPTRTLRAFTLMEVLIVIAIVLALGGLVYLNIMPAKEGADISTQRIQFDQMDAAMKMFKLHMKRWPNEDEGLAVLVRKDAVSDEAQAANWQGPYLEGGLPKDKWDHEVVYRIPSEVMGEGYYDLVSWGPDGQEGTGDDITNHDRMKNAQGDFETPDGAAADGATTPPPATGG